ncbi:MAG: hypothetical protein Q8S21_04285 [Candidatus Paracaedibacteraceae bacterium]|nr:hypothetical protein [Candidatus Paracaedibacteraceae bacterium]
MKNILILLALSTGFASMPCLTSTALAATESKEDDYEIDPVSALFSEIGIVNENIEKYNRYLHDSNQSEDHYNSLYEFLHIKENVVKAVEQAASEPSEESIIYASTIINELINYDFYMHLKDVVSAYQQDEQAQLNLILQQLEAEDAAEIERLATTAFTPPRPQTATAPSPTTSSTQNTPQSQSPSSTPLTMRVQPDYITYDRTKPFAFHLSFRNDKNAANNFINTLNTYYQTNRRMPNHYVGLTNEQKLERKNQWIHDHLGEIKKELDRVLWIFDHKVDKESQCETRYKALCRQNSHQPQENSEIVLYRGMYPGLPIPPHILSLAAPTSSSSTSIHKADILALPESMLLDLSGPRNEAEEPTRLIHEPKRGLTIAFNKIKFYLDRIETANRNDTINNNAMIIDNAYSIGRSLVEIQKIKDDRPTVYQDFMKMFIHSIASAGTHCNDGLRDAANLIYGKSQRDAAFQDDLTAQADNADSKVQFLLLNLRESVFLTVSNFEDDNEPGATKTNYRREMAGRIAISSTSAAQYGGVGHHTTKPGSINEDTFLHRFFNGKVGNSNYPSAEERKSYDGYTPKSIFIALWNALNHPATNIQPLSTSFPTEFVLDFCQKTDINDSIFANIFADIMKNNIVMKSYAAEIFQIPLNDVTSEEIEGAKEYLMPTDNSVSRKQRLLELGTYIKRDQTTNKYAIINHKLILYYLTKKGIITKK